MKPAIDQMPAEVATTLLTSGQSTTNHFRKVCKAARERICEPQSRSTRLNISAPKTAEQRLQARLRKATAKQLHAWAKRTLARGNRLQDLLFGCLQDDEETFKLLTQQVAAHDALCEAINAELTTRSARGIGYKKPIKRAGRP